MAAARSRPRRHQHCRSPQRLSRTRPSHPAPVPRLSGLCAWKKTSPTNAAWSALPTSAVRRNASMSRFRKIAGWKTENRSSSPKTGGWKTSWRRARLKTVAWKRWPRTAVCKTLPNNASSTAPKPIELPKNCDWNASPRTASHGLARSRYDWKHAKSGRVASEDSAAVVSGEESQAHQQLPCLQLQRAVHLQTSVAVARPTAVRP